MTAALRTTANIINNPVRPGMAVRIPAGTVVRSMNPKHTAPRVTRRATTVLIRIVSPGYIDLYGDRSAGAGYVVLPTITWAGEAGYWQDAKLTPELCEAIGVEVPTLPVLAQFELDRLDTVPSYGPGYDDRFTVTD